MKEADNPVETLKTRFNATLKASQLLIMPYFNEFLGGRPVNRMGGVKGRGRYREFVGPVLRSRVANWDESEIYMLDGTFLGTIAQLKTLSTKTS